MKHVILLEQLKRKLKIFLSIGLIGFLMVGALVVWAGVATFKSVASLGTNPNVQEKIVKLETGIKNMPALTKVGCWTTTQSLLKVEVWLEKPFADNVNSIKFACLN